MLKSNARPRGIVFGFRRRNGHGGVGDSSTAPSESSRYPLTYTPIIFVVACVDTPAPLRTCLPCTTLPKCLCENEFLISVQETEGPTTAGRQTTSIASVPHDPPTPMCNPQRLLGAVPSWPPRPRARTTPCRTQSNAWGHQSHRKRCRDSQFSGVRVCTSTWGHAARSLSTRESRPASSILL